MSVATAWTRVAQQQTGNLLLANDTDRLLQADGMLFGFIITVVSETVLTDWSDEPAATSTLMEIA